MGGQDLVGPHIEVPFPRSRQLSVDTVEAGRRKHHIPVLVEIDVTEPRRRMDAIRRERHAGVSFTGWFIKCLAQAAWEHPQVHSARRGNRIVLFDDVDVGTLVNRPIAGTDPPRSVPMPFILRRSNMRSLEEIQAAIRDAQDRPLVSGQTVIDPAGELPASPRTLRWFNALPGFVRRALVWNRMLRDPLYLKRMCGTITVTSVGMYGRAASGAGWGIPIGFAPLVVALGTITRKAGVVEDRVEPREILHATFLFDHDVVDGVPIATFLTRLNQLMDAGFGLPAEAPSLPRAIRVKSSPAASD